MGHTEEQIPAGGMNMGIVFGATFLAHFVEASAVGYVLTGIGNLNALNGLIAGLVVGIGIAAASSLPHRLLADMALKFGQSKLAMMFSTLPLSVLLLARSVNSLIR